LPERGRLGTRTRQLVESGRVRYVSMRIAEVRRASGGLLVIGEDGETLGPVDEILAGSPRLEDVTLAHLAAARRLAPSVPLRTQCLKLSRALAHLGVLPEPLP
jgi:hypothetical protein